MTGGLWGGLEYRPELYATVQPFVVVNFAIYLALAVRFATRSARVPERSVAVDGALVFGLPAATFALQAGLIDGVVPYGRAWSAVVLAAVYLVGAALLRRRLGVRLLSDAFLAVGLTFATLALPFAFQRVVFGALWVLEGAGLVWVGARQRKAWMRWGGVALQVVAAVVLFGEGVLERGTFTAESLTGWIVAVGLALSAYVLRDAVGFYEAEGASATGSAVGDSEGATKEVPSSSGQGEGSRGRAGGTFAEHGTLSPSPPSPPAEEGDLPGEADVADSATSPTIWQRVGLDAVAERGAGRLLFAFALLWWAVTAAVHVLDLAPDRWVLAGMLGAAAASGALFLGLGRALSWQRLAASALGVVPVGWVLWVAAVVTSTAPVVAGRLPAWLALLAVAGIALAALRDHRLRSAAFIGAVWLGTAVVARSVGLTVADVADGAWSAGAAGAVLVAALAWAVRLPASVADASERWRTTVGLVLAVGVWIVASWEVPGSAPPLRFVPLLNLLAIPTIAGLLALTAARSVAPKSGRRVLTLAVGALGFGALTVEVLRTVSVWGGVRWTGDALWSSSGAQAALAVTWTLLALVLAIVAVRRQSRALWFVGAGVLGVVVAKLFLVDLSQAQALFRVVAFMVVGALVLLIGYRAPLPPAVGDDETPPDDEPGGDEPGAPPPSPVDGPVGDGSEPSATTPPPPSS